MFDLPQTVGSETNLMTGIVVSRNDPQQKNRVRVRWFGYYSEDIPIEELPWSIVVLPSTSAGIGGVGSTHGLMEGSLVLGSWLDGKDRQNAIVYGSINPVEGAFGGSNAGGGSAINNVAGSGVVNSQGVLDMNTATNTPSNVSFSGSGPRWYQIAQAEIGQKEIRGGSHNPRVLEYARTNGFTDDETPWCASFCKWCCQNAGVSVSGINGLARSFSRSSAFERIQEPLQGCIVVFSRPPNPQSGHVAFLDSVQGGRLRVLGGNQANAVNIQGYPSSRLVGFYWPAGQPRTPSGSAAPAASDSRNIPTVSGSEE